jgi:hypothetical protein
MAWHKCVILEASDGWIVKDDGGPPVKISAKESAVAAAIRVARKALSDTESDGCVQVIFQLKNGSPKDRH